MSGFGSDSGLNTLSSVSSVEFGFGCRLTKAMLSGFELKKVMLSGTVGFLSTSSTLFGFRHGITRTVQDFTNIYTSKIINKWKAYKSLKVTETFARTAERGKKKWSEGGEREREKTRFTEKRKERGRIDEAKKEKKKTKLPQVSQRDTHTKLKIISAWFIIINARNSARKREKSIGTQDWLKGGKMRIAQYRRVWCRSYFSGEETRGFRRTKWKKKTCSRIFSIMNPWKLSVKVRLKLWLSLGIWNASNLKLKYLIFLHPKMHSWITTVHRNLQNKIQWEVCVCIF